MLSGLRNLKFFRFCAALSVLALMLCISACGKAKASPEASDDIPSAVPSHEAVFSGTYVYSSDSYTCAVEFDELGSLWFYEATADGSLEQGMAASLETIDMSGTDTPADCYWLPFYAMDFSYVKAAYVHIVMSDGDLLVTPLSDDAPLSEHIAAGETIRLSPTYDLSLTNLIVGLYADELAG